MICLVISAIWFMETFLSELYILVSKFRFFDSRRIHPVFENCCFSGILADFAESYSTFLRIKFCKGVCCDFSLVLRLSYSACAAAHYKFLSYNLCSHWGVDTLDPGTALWRWSFPKNFFFLLKLTMLIFLVRPFILRYRRYAFLSRWGMLSLCGNPSHVIAKSDSFKSSIWTSLC